MVLKIYRYLLALILVFTMTSRAAEIEPEKIQVWPDRTNFYGSPNNYYYIASSNGLNAYSQSALPVLTHKLKWSTKIFASPLGNYWAVGNFDDKVMADFEIMSVDVYTPSGTRLYTVKDPQALKFILNDSNAALVGIDGVEGIPQANLIFYGEDGQEIDSYALTQFTRGDFCATADYFLAHSADSGLYVFKPQGELQYRILISPYYGFSPDGLSVLSVDGSRMNFHYRETRTNSVGTEITAPKSIRFAPDNKNVFIMTRQKIYCYSLPELSRNWEYALSSGNEYFSSLSISPDSRQVAVGITIDKGSDYSVYDRYNTGRIEILDSTGSKAIEGSLECASWSSGYPKVEFSSDSQRVWIISPLELFVLTLN